MKMIFELLPNCLGSPENKEAVFASCWKCRTANTIRNITEIRKPPLAYRHRRSYHLSNLFSSQSSFLFLTCSILLWMFFRVLQVFFFSCNVHSVQCQSHYRQQDVHLRHTADVGDDKEIEFFTFQLFRGGSKFTWELPLLFNRVKQSEDCNAYAGAYVYRIQRLHRSVWGRRLSCNGIVQWHLAGGKG